MKRYVTTVAALSLFAAAMVPSASADHPVYGWTISDSSTNPFSNEGPFIPSIQSLKLWYACNVNDGMSAAAFDLVSMNPANIILAVTTKSGFLNAGAGTALLLAIGGCPNAPINAADILVLNVIPGQYCIAPSSVTGLKETIDCNQTSWPMQWIGYSNDGNPPCSKDWDLCHKPTAVEDGSWGRIKSIYR
jgi:hypothetical protein